MHLAGEGKPKGYKHRDDLFGQYTQPHDDGSVVSCTDVSSDEEDNDEEEYTKKPAAKKPATKTQATPKKRKAVGPSAGSKTKKTPRSAQTPLSPVPENPHEDTSPKDDDQKIAVVPSPLRKKKAAAGKPTKPPRSAKKPPSATKRVTRSGRGA